MAASGGSEPLGAKAERFLRQARGVRRPHTDDIFVRRAYLGPDEVRVENYLRPRPIAFFNPGAVLRGDVVHVFPRLIFEYYSYASAVGHFEVPVQVLLSGRFSRPVPVDIVLYPTERFDAVRGCEDARAHWMGDGYALFYTAVGKLGEAWKTDSKDVFTAALALAELGEDLRLRRKGLIRIEGRDEEAHIPVKNATFLDGEAFLLRPSLPGIPDTCWRGRLDRATLEARDLEPVLAPEPFEYKVGWSTNAVALGDGTFLVGYHGIFKEDLSYRHGLAHLDGQGALLGVSDYLLAPQGLNECYGDRPLTLYGNGLFIYNDELVWVGGVGDYAIGVFSAPLEAVMARIRPLV